MKALVTGGAGFIGSHLVEALVTKGVEVTVIDNLSTGSLNNLKSLQSKICILEKDIQDDAILMSAMKGMDWVFHLAAQTTVSGSVANPQLTHAVNNSGTLNILWAALKAQVTRVVISSSCAVYGDLHFPPLKESYVPSPKSPYAASKLFAESLAHSFYYSYGLETVCLRYFNVYGQRQNTKSDYAAVIPCFIECYHQNKPPVIYGDGQQSRDFIHVNDVVNSNYLAASIPQTALSEHRVFNIGSGEDVTLRQLLDLISEEAGYVLPPNFQPARLGDIRVSKADLEITQKYLGFSPKVSLKEGIRDLYYQSRPN